MKKLILSISLSLLFLFSFSPGDEAFAYDKKSLVERFTNCSCGPCAAINNSWYNAITQDYINSGLISHIVYNVNWPAADDPMYLLNAADNMARRTYYGVNYVPWIDINGSQINETLSAFTTAVANGNAEYAPFNIILTQQVCKNDLIEIGVKIIRDPSDISTFGDVKLRVALTEKTVSFSSPPGNNGESEFYSVCRKMMPDANGSTFAIPAAGDSIELTLQYVPTTAFLQSVNFDSIRVVAFLQDDPSKEMYQSSMLELTPDYKSEIELTSTDFIGDNTTPAEFSTVIRNIGILDDSYEISANFDTAPVGWTGEYTTENGTFSFGQTDLIQVAVGDTSVISISVNPNGTNGSGVTLVEYSSQDNPGMSGSAVLRNVTTGIEILVVDDDDGANYEEWIIVELDSLNSEYGVVASDAVVNAGEDINSFNTIIWSCANINPTIEPDEMAAIKTFLDNGGYLYLSGVNIAYELADPTSPYYTTETADFVTDYLHTNYILKEYMSNIAEGIDGDPISDGFPLLGLVGGTGASTIDHSQGHYPNQIDAADTASAPFLHFFLAPDDFCGVRAIHYGPLGIGRVVFTSFGFETIANASARSFFAERVSNWLTVPVGVNEFENNSIPTSYGLEQNYPNPFNPSTTITYSLANEEHVSLKVYDIMGREIAELVNEDQTSGTYSLEFDASSLASGMYFYKISAGNFVSTKKMVLLK